MGYIVTAPLVIAKNDDGGDVYVYEGAPVPDGQSDEWIENHVRDGMIEEGDAPSGDVSVDEGGSSRSKRSRSNE